jgi:hypothetical protein
VSTGNALVIYQEPLGISGDQIGVLSFSLTSCSRTFLDAGKSRDAPSSPDREGRAGVDRKQAGSNSPYGSGLRFESART